MEVELSQAILAIDNELKGNIHYSQWAFIMDKLKHLEIANGSVWGIISDCDEENETLRNRIEELEKKIIDLGGEV